MKIKKNFSHPSIKTATYWTAGAVSRLRYGLNTPTTVLLVPLGSLTIFY